MKTISIVGAILLSAATSVAYAQNTPAPTSSTQPTPAPSSSEPSTQQGAGSVGAASGGMRMGEAAPPVIVRFANMRPADTMSSTVVGTHVYNNKNEAIGEIEDLVIQNGRTITGVVVSTGGFLGMGDRYVLIEPSSIVLGQKDGSMRAFINTTKENLKDAPAFSYKKKK